MSRSCLAALKRLFCQRKHINTENKQSDNVVNIQFYVYLNEFSEMDSVRMNDIGLLQEKKNSFSTSRLSEIMCHT